MCALTLTVVRVADQLESAIPESLLQETDGSDRNDLQRW